MRIVCVLLILGVISVSEIQGQQQVIPLERFHVGEVQRSLLTDSVSRVHMGMKPILARRVDLSRVTGYQKDSTKYYYSATRLLFRDHLVEVKSGDFHCTIDPLIEFGTGVEFRDTSAYSDTTNFFTNSRGLLIQADIGKKVSIQTGFYETQQFLPAYLKAYNEATGVMPGLGRTKLYKTGGVDYNMSFGWVSYSPSDRWNFQFGHDKHFIGFGYRSLLLSDAAFNYPFVKGQVRGLDGKLEYTVIGASLQSLERLPLGEVPEALFKKKGANFHYLSYRPVPQLEIGLFEGIVWQRWDSTGIQSLPVLAYIPVEGVSTAALGWNDKHNVLNGLNARAVIAKRVEVYGQLALDDISRPSVGYQLGAHAYNLGFRNLDVQIEWNSTGDYFYAHTIGLQSYSHFNQPLGHPLGAGLSEWVGILDYRYRRWIFQIKGVRSGQSTGPSSQWNADPEAIWPHVVYQKRELDQLDLMASYYLNPKTNARIAVSYTMRKEYLDGYITRHTGFFFVTLRSSIHNKYFDF